ncbi:chromosomal replication initiator DnaA [Thioclava sp. SK-1]|uniref:HdaA/DnaA family protein n=1 Tax=Thioclava sp. SK-1 TaxID=1889770 RepID=UPI000826A434|nr:DnaA/Hda family protein [Thioclava sp. SK-1]OCX67082.1 chromosomal replication initiator DnaA [Thioclava sp. SK-1]
MTGKQLIFDLPLRSSQGREDFYVAQANALALATLDGPAWPAGRMLLLGDHSAGKTHLAQIWADEHRAPLIPATELTEFEPPFLASAGAVVIDNADAIAGQRDREAQLFHLHNLCQAEGVRLLLTASGPPRDWGLVLPDLRSRMEATASVRILAPDDALLAAVLVKMFADRQIHVPVTLIPWLVSRMDRKMAVARAMVAALDARSLEEKRAITRPLAQQVLDSLRNAPQN